jgi:hypothetical protein
MKISRGNRMAFSKAIIFVLIMLSSFTVHSYEIAGIQIPDNTMVAGQTLQLNGAGIRSKFFFKIYVGALYLSKSANTSMAVYQQKGPKSILMSFLYDEVPADKLISAWNEGFEENNDSKELSSLSERIKQFNALFVTAHKGDTIRLDMIPGKGTLVWFGDKLQATVAGDDFALALQKIWLGEKPADDDLKEGMLNQ